MLKIDVAAFEWDGGNNNKCGKHGITAPEIEAFFQSRDIFIAPDFKHSAREERYFAVGAMPNGRYAFVAFTIVQVRYAPSARGICIRKRGCAMKKLLPKLKTDQQAEDLLEGDMSAYLHAANFKRASFEFMPKTEKVNLRLSAALLEAVKKKAGKNHVPYQRFIRHILEQAVL